MMYSQFLTSFILIVCGFLVEKFPDLIAGYNTKRETEKKKINIKELSKFLMKLLIALGVLTILIYFLLDALQILDTLILKINAFLIVLFIVVALIYVNTNKKFKN